MMLFVFFLQAREAETAAQKRFEDELAEQKRQERAEAVSKKRATDHIAEREAFRPSSHLDIY